MVGLSLNLFNHNSRFFPIFFLQLFYTVAELRPILSVPEDEEIIMGIALGYAADDGINGFASSRLPLSEILTVKE